MAHGGDRAVRSPGDATLAGVLTAVALLVASGIAAAQTLPDLPWLAPSLVNAGSLEILIFGRDGRRVCVAGRRGEGPGEFPSAPALVPAQRYDSASDGGARWLAYDGGGTPLGIVRTPPGLHVWQVGTDFLLGVAKDEWGEERVERYVLNRNRGGVGQ